MALSTFNVSFMHNVSRCVIGLYDITMKVPLSQETLNEFKRILETEFYYVLTFSQQERGERGEREQYSTESDSEEGKSGESGESESDSESEGEGEGGNMMFAEEFADHTYQLVLRAFDQISHLFGEDASVTLDMNLDDYQANSFNNLIYWDSCLSIGANATEEQRAQWTFIPFRENEPIRHLLEVARVM